MVYGSLYFEKRKLLDYELFEKQAMNNNKTYQFITSMQEIKLTKLRTTAPLGMGGCTSRPVPGQHEIIEITADSGSGKHLHQ